MLKTWLQKSCGLLRNCQMAKRPKGKMFARAFFRLAFFARVLLLSNRVGSSVGANCTDGFDDVYSLALEHWVDGGNKVEAQSMATANLDMIDLNCDRCQSCRVASQYKEEIVNGTRIVAANGMPYHEFEVYDEGHQKNPNDACPQPVYMALNTTPTKGSKFHTSGLGPVGLAISGAFLFNHLSNPNGDEDVAAVQEDRSFDTCMGHSAPGCVYHYHRAPKTGCIPGWNECTLVGWLRDGFPVYSYCKKRTGKRTGLFLKTCYEKKEGLDGGSTWHYEFNRARFESKDCDLDEANGYTFPESEWKGTRGINGYGYVFSENYPFIMPGYFGSELHPVVTLDGHRSCPTLLLVVIGSMFSIFTLMAG